MTRSPHAWKLLPNCVITLQQLTRFYTPKRDASRPHPHSLHLITNPRISTFLIASTTQLMSGADARETISSHGLSHPSISRANPAAMDPSHTGPRQPPTSAEIDAAIAAAIANAPPAPPPMDMGLEASTRSLTPLMTNILPSAIGSDGRVNLFVGNLPYRVRWQDLKDFFRKAGTVLRADVSLGPDNRSRGYGNVLMGSREDAARAIDRFNGFTWQTRTLEVRPDRLPPEYEPQPHIHHKPMFGGYMGSPMHHFGSGGGGGWHGRPPHHGPPFGGFGHHLGPGSHGGGHAPHQAFVRPPPSLAAHVPAVPPIGASPLAGSLTAGPNAAASAAAAGSLGWATGGNREVFSGADRSGSLATLGALPLGANGKRSVSPNRGLEPGESMGRVALGGRLGPSLLGKPAISAETLGSSASLRRPSTSGSDAPTPALVPPPIPLNGLANQAKDLGAPNSVYDRVCFVKNLPFTMQWQDLKDLFRPAGVVIRADVATTPDGQSRGFGTVLLASPEDAQRAASMFNGHDVDGRVLNVQTERQTIDEGKIQPMHAAEPFSAFATKPSPQGWPKNASPPVTTRTPASEAFASGPLTGSAVTPSATRVPWPLDTGGAATPVRPGVNDDPALNKPRHPGPITLPPFPTMTEMNPLSPMQTRNLPPMTPSMPGFVFNAYPRTPPAPHHFLSAGAAGPFSPGAPVTSPVHSGRNPLLNAAPGAPVYRPLIQKGSAALGTPTTQVFPDNSDRPGAGAPGGEVDDYFPPVKEKADEELVGATAALSVKDDNPVDVDHASTGLPGMAPEVTVTATSPPANGRSSFDGGLRGGGPTERRASWSEVAKG
ncbi:hypothetical protein CcaverHIS631_0302390 [Cutaneotrichosporon cavernicola]|nr:hypothetical protein CcaverHIS631_0302390 [Cutaneotrichosporon cavernicola]